MRCLLLAFTFVAAVRAADAPLAIVRPAFAQTEDGPSVPSSFEFSPGDTVHFTARVAGVGKTEEEKIFVSFRVEARDAAGVALAPPETGKVVATLAPEDKDWMPKISAAIQLPPYLSRGAYRVFVSALDELRKREAQAEFAFRVAGRDLPAGGAFTVENFHFFRGENDREPLAVAAYRPGDTVWARFDILGFTLGDHNRFDVSYGLKVLRPSGKVTLDQEEAATAAESPFYPQRFVPGVLSLTLPKDVARGEYTIDLTVRDRVGGKHFQKTYNFQVE